MASEKFMELLKPYSNQWGDYYDRLIVGGFTVSIQEEAKKKINIPEKVSFWMVMIFGVAFDQLLPFLPEHIVEKYDAPPSKNKHSNFDHLTARETQDLLDLLGRHGTSIKENQPAPDEPVEKNAGIPLSLAKRKKEGPSSHPYTRPGVWRKNYDFGTGFSKMVDEFRDGKIKDTHEFIEQKRKEPNPIKDLYEPDKKKKKRKKAPLSKKAGQPEFEVSVYPINPHSVASLQDRKQFSDPNDAFKWARSQAGPGMYVVIIPEFDAEQLADHSLIERHWQSNDGADFKEYINASYSDMQEFYGRNLECRPHLWQTTGRKPNIVPWLGEFDAQYKLATAKMPLSKRSTVYDDFHDYAEEIPTDGSKEDEEAKQDFVDYVDEFECEPKKKKASTQDAQQPVCEVRVFRGPKGYDLVSSTKFSDPELAFQDARKKAGPGYEVLVLPQFYEERDGLIVDRVWVSIDGADFKEKQPSQHPPFHGKPVQEVLDDDTNSLPIIPYLGDLRAWLKVAAALPLSKRGGLELDLPDGFEAETTHFVVAIYTDGTDPERPGKSNHELSRSFSSPEDAFSFANQVIGPGQYVDVQLGFIPKMVPASANVDWINEQAERHPNLYRDLTYAQARAKYDLQDNQSLLWKQFIEKTSWSALYNFHSNDGEPLRETYAIVDKSETLYRLEETRWVMEKTRGTKILQRGKLWGRQSSASNALAKQAAPEINLPDDLQTDAVDVFAKVWKDGVAIEGKEFQDPLDAFAWAENRIGPGQSVVITGRFYNDFRIPQSSEDLQQLVADYPQFFKEATFERIYDQIPTYTQHAFENGELSADDDSFVYAQVPEAKLIWRSYEDGRLALAQKQFSTAKAIYWVDYNGEVHGAYIGTFPWLEKQASFPFHRPPDLKHAFVAALATVYEGGKLINSKSFDSDTAAAKWADEQTGHNLRVQLTLDYYDGGEIGLDEESLHKAAQAPHCKTLSPFEVATLEVAPAVQRSVEKAGSAVLEHRTAARLQYTSQDGGPFEKTDESRTNASVLYWALNGRVYQARVQNVKKASAAPAMDLPDDFTTDHVKFQVRVQEAGNTPPQTIVASSLEDAFRRAQMHAGPGSMVNVEAIMSNDRLPAPMKPTDLASRVNSHPHRFKDVSEGDALTFVDETGTSDTDAYDVAENAERRVIQSLGTAVFVWHSVHGSPFNLVRRDVKFAKRLHMVLDGEIYSSQWMREDLG